MEYHQYLQFVQAQQKALGELAPAARWEVHTPAVARGFRRIRSLVRSLRKAEYTLVHRLVAEVETELSSIKERLSSCSID